MHVLNSGPRLRIYTFDGDQVIRLRPGESAEVEGAKHVDARDVETETHEHHRSLYSSMLADKPVTYRTDDYDSGDAR